MPYKVLGFGLQRFGIRTLAILAGMASSDRCVCSRNACFLQMQFLVTTLLILAIRFKIAPQIIKEIPLCIPVFEIPPRKPIIAQDGCPEPGLGQESISAIIMVE